MRTFRDYTQLTEDIHAPANLKARVLWAARNSAASAPAAPAEPVREEKRRPGRYSRGFGLMPKVAAAVVLLLVLPLTAYAAVRQMTLKDHFVQQGVEDIQAVEALTNTFATDPAPDATKTADKTTAPQAPAPDYKNDFAEYRVAEVICDSQTIYIRCEIKPTTDKYLVVPEDFWSSDDVSRLNIPGASGMTIEEYAKQQNKPIMAVGLGYYVGEDFLQGGLLSEMLPDGTISSIYSAQNISNAKEFTLTCTPYAVAHDGSQDLHDKFEVQVSDKSTSQKGVLKTNFDSRISSEIPGLEMLSMDVEQTELGTYFTFTYRCELAEREEDQEGYNFRPVDAQGNDIPNLPDQTSTGNVRNDDDTFYETVFCQKQASLDGIQFKIRRWSDAAWFGPYDLPN